MKSHNQAAVPALERDAFPKLSVSVTIATLAVMAIIAFAVFANGGYFPDAMTACVVGAWICFLIYCAAGGAEVFRGWSPAQIATLGIALVFWLWTGLSISWSISSDESLIEFNRTGGYVAVLAIGIMVGRYKASRRLATILFLAIAAVTAIYGLGPKVFPLSVENLDDMGRLAIPIGYVNALGILMAMGYVVSIYVSSDKAVYWVIRTLSAMMAPVLLICLFFTLSRGATLALLLGLAVYFAVTPVRLRSFGIVLISLIPAVVVARWSSAQDALTRDRADMSERVLAASTLRWYVVASVLAAGLAFTIIIYMGRRVTIPPIAGKVAGSVILATLLLSIMAGSIWFVSSKPSFRDWSSQAYHDIRYGAPSNEGTGRLLEMGSSGRWTLWEESIKNWEEHPYLGSGGQSFALIHLLQRDDGLIFVKQPHSHPFQLLAEFGLVGFLLGMAFISTAVTFCTLTLCRQRDRWERSLAAAILSMLIIYLIHASFDWDWNMFAITAIYFFFTGIMLGWPGQVSRRSMKVASID